MHQIGPQKDCLDVCVCFYVMAFEIHTCTFNNKIYRQSVLLLLFLSAICVSSMSTDGKGIHLKIRMSQKFIATE